MVLDNLVVPAEHIVMGFDCKHASKQIRNNVLRSGYGSDYKPLRIWGVHEIVWQHWQDAYDWDCSANQEIQRVHHKLTREHLEPKDASKMGSHPTALVPIY